MSGKKKHPSKALLKDLDKLFNKHNWPGTSIGIRALSLKADTNECPPGTKKTEVTYQLSDGTIVTKTVCL